MMKKIAIAILLAGLGTHAYAQSVPTKAQTQTLILNSIYANGRNGITGPILQSDMLQMLAVSASWQGAWSSTVAYSYGEIVTYNSAFWIANTPVTGTAPGVTSGQWTLFSADAASIDIGSTAINGGTSGSLLSVDGSVLGQAPMGSGVLPSLADSVNATGGITSWPPKAVDLAGTALAPNVIGSFLTSVGTLGTGTWQATPVGTAYGGLGSDNSAASGIPLFASGVVTFTGTTGTGNFVRATSPSVSGLTVTGSFTATGLVTNGDLVNDATTVNGQSCVLGSTCTITAEATNALTIGTHLTGGSYDGSAAVTIGTDATSAATPSTLMSRDASGNVAVNTLTGAVTGHASLDLAIANNLSDLASASTARTNLGLGTFATQNYATPPAIGGTTPNSGAFTTLAAQSTTGKTIGLTYYADQYDTFHDFVHDDSAPIQATINAASAAGGGTVVIGPYAYWGKTASITVPRGVTLTCGSYYQPPSRVSGGGAANYQNAPCSIYFASGLSLVNSGEVSKINIFADLVHFTPMDNSSTRAQMEAYVASFTGTGVIADNGTLGNADGGILRNVAIGGFAKCLSVVQAGQLKLVDVLGDCTNGMSVTQSYDDDFLRGIEFWPFLTANLAHVADSWTISSIADNGSGLWRLTLSAATNITTGEQLWVNPGTTAQGASGFWTVTAIDSTHVDLQGSASAPTTTGNTTNGQTYIAVASTANLQPGMTVSGSGIPSGATIGTVWRGVSAISLDQSHAATGTATGVTLTFGSTPYTSGGTLNYDGAFRFGTAFALGRADGLTCNACFAFGYQIGFNLNDAFGLSLVNTQVDNNGQIAANQDVTPIGIEFTGSNAYGNFISGSLITSDGVNILSNTSNTAGSYANTVEGFRTAGSAPLPSTAVEIDNGALIVQGLLDGGAHTIAIAPAAGTSVLTANQIAATIVFSAGTPNWQGAGNNLGGIAGFNAPQSTAMGDVTITSGLAADSAPATINGANNADGAGLKFIGNGATTPNKFIRVISGVMQWLNSTYSAAIMTMDDVGDLTITGNFKAAAAQFTGLNVAGIVTNTSAGLLGTETAITPAQCPLATGSATGCVKPDGTTITVSGGVITAVGGAGGGSSPCPVVPGLVAGTTDNAPAINAVLTAAGGNSVCLGFPKGTYEIDSAISYTLNAGASLSIEGAGQDVTNIFEKTNSGITINYADQYSSAHIRDLYITAGTTRGTGLGLVQSTANSNPALSAQTDISNVTIRGNDGYDVSNYFSQMIETTNVSNIDFIDDAFIGTGTNSSGVALNGQSASAQAVQFNFIGDTFSYGDFGLSIGAFVQGVSISSSNFTGSAACITVPTGITDGTTQLSVSSSQFNCSSADLLLNSKTTYLTLTGNVFLGALATTTVGIQGIYTHFTIVGNTFSAGSGAGNNAIVAASGSQYGTISSNVFTGWSGGVLLQSGSSGILVGLNTYISVTTKTQNSASSACPPSSSGNCIGSATSGTGFLP